MNTLPEILVKEHQLAVWGRGNILAESSAAVTIAHIGKALEWAQWEGYSQSVTNRGQWWKWLEHEMITTEELVNKYFESLK